MNPVCLFIVYWLYLLSTFLTETQRLTLTVLVNVVSGMRYLISNKIAGACYRLVEITVSSIHGSNFII